MNFTKLVSMGYNGLAEDEPCCVLDNGNLSVFLFQNKEFADKDRPEIRLISGRDIFYIKKGLFQKLETALFLISDKVY